jgi:hypothetical protein
MFGVERRAVAPASVPAASVAAGHRFSRPGVAAAQGRYPRPPQLDQFGVSACSGAAEGLACQRLAAHESAGVRSAPARSVEIWRPGGDERFPFGRAAGQEDLGQRSSWCRRQTDVTETLPPALLDPSPGPDLLALLGPGSRRRGRARPESDHRSPRAVWPLLSGSWYSSTWTAL